MRAAIIAVRSLFASRSLLSRHGEIERLLPDPVA